MEENDVSRLVRIKIYNCPCYAALLYRTVLYVLYCVLRVA